MANFYGYSFSKNSSVAMDEQEEKMVTIRRIFRIDPKVQKDLGHESKPEEPNDRPDATAKDMALYLGGFAMDLSPRHAKTPIAECRAEDPRYCPYHGADYMTSQLDEAFKKAGIYAMGGVERLGQGKFKVQYSVPESKKAAANGIIDKFLASPGFLELDAEDKKDAELIDAIGDLGDDVGRGFRTDRGNDDFAMREEHLDSLEKDMKDGMEIDPSELYQLRKDHHELKKLGKAAWEAADEAGINPASNSKESREWKASNEKWQAYRAASQKFSDDYNYIRGNADLAHVKTPEDCKELMGHLEKQITQVGDFVKASEEVETLKAKKGVKGKKGIPGMKEFNDARGKIRFAIDGLKDARKQVEDANASGDVKKMRAAAHSLELVLNQVKDGKDAIAESLKQAESFRKYLEGLPDVGDDAGKPSEKAKIETPNGEVKPDIYSKNKKPSVMKPTSFADLMPIEKKNVANHIGFEAVKKLIGGTKWAESVKPFIRKAYGSGADNDMFYSQVFIKFPDKTPEKDVNDVAKLLTDKLDASCVDTYTYPESGFKIIDFGKDYPSVAANYLLNGEGDSSSKKSPAKKVDTPAKKYIESISKNPSAKTNTGAETPPKKAGLMQILTKGKKTNPKKG